MIVCIAEKPSVARDLARVMGANDRHDGYISGNGYVFTWTFGHLCELKDPDEYDERWRAWSIVNLPIIPQQFGIKLKNDSGIAKQFEIIKQLVAQASIVINCGDAGQEGELIQRWVLQHALCKAPIKRLWISSLTDEAIKEGFASLLTNDQLDPLYYAGLSRAIGDWLLGINATRLFTIKYAPHRQVLSIGRVQTPTLALIVDRQREIENFTPVTNYELQTVYRDTLFRSEGDKYATTEEVNEIIESIKEIPLTIIEIEQKKSKEYPPRLFDLTSLQVEANKKHNLTADETLKAIQSLYERKLTTYPRVDTTFLPDDLYPKIGAIFQNLNRVSTLSEHIAPLLSEAKFRKSKKVFNSSKVTDHHAIIPTGVIPNGLSSQEECIYSLVVYRFIAAFYPEALLALTTVRAAVDQYQFKANGRQVLNDGWYTVLKKTQENADNDGEDDNSLPTFVKNESGSHQPQMKETTSQAPKLYTEATLLRAMETAGKQVQDDDLRDAMKENGIGRPSTRAAIIETLFKRNYIYRSGKSLKASDIGCNLIDLIDNPLLKSAELTGLWERNLRLIEQNKYEPSTFINELKDMVQQLIKEVRKF